MKKKLLTAILLVGALFGSASAMGIQKRVRLQREFTLRAGSEAFVSVAGLRLRFKELVEDSRCSEGVDCIWAGNGKINLSVTKGRRKSVSFDLNTMSEPMTFVYQGYEITLVKLSPYPKHDVTTKKEEYVATLKVTKTK